MILTEQLKEAEDGFHYDDGLAHLSLLHHLLHPVHSRSHRLYLGVHVPAKDSVGFGGDRGSVFKLTPNVFSEVKGVSTFIRQEKIEINKTVIYSSYISVILLLITYYYSIY